MLRIRQRLQNESGQAAVFIALLSGVLLFFVAATTNIGKVVTEKIAMQDAVDLAVFAGASTQAGYFNKMRFYNQKTWTEIDNDRKYWETSKEDFTDFLCPGGCVDVEGPCDPASPTGMDVPLQDIKLQLQWTQTIQGYNQQIAQLNTKANKDAIDAATKTADANYSGTGAKLQPLSVSKGQQLVTLMHQDVISMTYFGWCIGLGGPEKAQFRTGGPDGTPRLVLPSWTWKQDSGQAMFAAGIVGAVPNSPFVDISGGYFSNGGCSYGETSSGGRCSLDVYAAAEPFFGKLGSNLQQQTAPWEKLTGTSDAVNEQDITQLDEDSRLDKSQVIQGPNYRDYGARFIGVFETAQVSGKNQPLSQLVPFQGKMRH